MRCMNNVLEEFYFQYSFFLQRHVYVFLLAPVFVTLVLSSGFYFINVRNWNDTEYVFSPSDGYSKFEQSTFNEHFPLDQDNYFPGQSFELKHYFYISITAKPDITDEKLLRTDILHKIQDLNSYVLNNLTVLSYDGLFNVSYRQICLLIGQKSCYGNEHIELLQHMDFLTSTDFPVRYPTTRLFHNAVIYLPGLLGDVTANSTNNALESVGALRLVYFMKHEPQSYNFYSIQFSNTLSDYLLHFYRSDLFDVTFGTEKSLTEGVQDNTTRYIPAIGVSALLIMIFVFLCSFMFYRTPRGTFIDWVRSKPLLALVGIIEPAMAVGSTCGLLLLIGCPINSIIVVMPFLVFAIGVDDMFIMISAWHNTNLSDKPEKRFAEAMSEAAVAVTVTSCTDIIAFAVGTWNPLPAMQIFCYYTATAMFFELVYQCTFYAAALYLVGKAESKGLHCLTFKGIKSVTEADSKMQRYFCVGSKMNVRNMKYPNVDECAAQVAEPLEHFEHHQDSDHELLMVQSFFRKYYGPILLRTSTKIFVAFLFVAYLILALWGTMIMPSGLQPEKLVNDNHYVHKYLKNERLWKDGVQLQILVNNPPPLIDDQRRVDTFRMVAELESSEFTMGPTYTMFWMREYEKYLLEPANKSQNLTKYTPNSIVKWLESTGSRDYWKSCLSWTNCTEETSIRAFRFAVGLKNYYGQMEQQKSLVNMRALLATYTDMNLTCYQQLSPFVDQYLVIYKITFRNTMISLVIIVVLTLFLIPHFVCGVFMTMSVLSIDVGVSGFLCWWNVNMDCISMITIIIATGFAVDLSAHVSYAYVRATGTANERAVKALETLGWPVFQGVTATFLGVLIMGTVDAYMFKVFFKTIVLVILFGLLHSLVFLPVGLTVFVNRNLNVCPKKCTCLPSALA